MGSILAVLIAGGILVELNMVVVQLLTKTLAGIEIEICLQRREFEEEDEFDLQYSHIYSSQLYCSIAIGLVGGALVGAAGGYPIGGMKSSPLRVALLIAGIAWFVLYVIATVVKYPPRPEALFASGAAGTYQSLLEGYGAVSGLALRLVLPLALKR